MESKPCTYHGDLGYTLVELMKDLNQNQTDQIRMDNHIAFIQYSVDYITLGHLIAEAQSIVTQKHLES